MIYQGSKAKLVKDIAPIIQKCIDENKLECYIEPFVGGANMIDSISCKIRIGIDINRELIYLLKYMKTHPKLECFPEECSFEHYAEVREARKNKSMQYWIWYTAGIGYFASYGGRYFDGGYGRDKTGKRNIYAERLAYAREQAPKLKGIWFYCDDYTSVEGARNCMIYLDPPYKGTKQYGYEFDYDKFYAFVRELSKENYVFISEYSMPEDFECIWSKERKVLQKSDRNQTEKRLI